MPCRRAGKVACLATALLAVTPTLATSKPLGHGTVIAPVRPTIAKMSESDCTGLGGTVRTDTDGLCLSGKVCDTTNEDHSKHHVCISKAK